MRFIFDDTLYFVKYLYWQVELLIVLYKYIEEVEYDYQLRHWKNNTFY